MGLFDRSMTYRARTSLFARRVSVTHQVLVFAEVGPDSEGERPIIVLPLPVPASAQASDVRFLDLSTSPGFFDQLDRAFPPEEYLPRTSQGPGGGSAGGSAPSDGPRPPAGAYAAHYVASAAELTALGTAKSDPVDLGAIAARYPQHGFAIFELDPKPRSWLARLTSTLAGRGRAPVGLEFPSRDPERLYFPSLHLASVDISRPLPYDHAYYIQADDPRSGAAWDNDVLSRGPRPAWEDFRRSRGQVEANARLSDGRPLLDPSRLCFRAHLRGDLQNAPRWVSFHVL